MPYERYKTCPFCDSRVFINGIHYCWAKVPGSEVSMKLVKRVWDNHLQCWKLLHEQEAHKGEGYFASCNTTPRTTPVVRSPPYVPLYPWLGVDREKWPKTWFTLFTLYFAPDWLRGKY